MGSFGGAKYLPLAAVRPQLQNPSGLRRWQARLADAPYTPAPITVLGDSTVQGVGSDNLAPVLEAAAYITNSFPGRLRSLFAASPLTGAIDPGVGIVKFDDYGLTLTGGVVTSKGPIILGRNLTAPGHQVAINGGYVGTRIDIVWWCNGNNAQTAPPVYSIDGGADVIAPAGVAGYNKVTVSGLALAAHTVDLKYNAAGSAGVYLNSVAFYRSDTPLGVPVHRVGTAGKTTNEIAGGSLGGAQADLITGTFYPHGTALAIIDCTINDWLTQLPLASFRANYQSLLDYITGTTLNSCALLIVPPRTFASDNLPIRWAQYVDVLKSLAVGHVSLMEMPELFGTNAQAADTVMGLMIPGTSHPSRRGYGVMAQSIFRGITGPGLGQQ